MGLSLNFLVIESHPQGQGQWHVPSTLGSLSSITRTPFEASNDAKTQKLKQTKEKLLRP